MPPFGPAIYFLLQGPTVIYVGASRRPGQRVWQHPGKDHDRALFLPVADGRLDELERHWIVTLRPKHNKQHNPDSSRLASPTFPIHTAVDERIGIALRRYMDSRPDGAKLKRVTERAYILLLTEEGFWPPPKGGK